MGDHESWRSGGMVSRRTAGVVVGLLAVLLLSGIEPAYPATSVSYYLPWKAGVSNTISQARAVVKGDSHTCPRLCEAFDFLMGGQEVLASATGKIVDSNDTVEGPTNAGFGNYVVIQHPDGKCTRYAHLELHSVTKLAKNAPVRVGEPIGIAGNTGYSRGAHLHFQREECGGNAIPVPFVETSGSLTAGMSLKSSNPGTEADQMVIESTDGQHMYVAAGGSLFWFNRSDATQRDFFLKQMRDAYGRDTQTLKRSPAEIHAIEINRDAAGNVKAGSHMPRDHTLVVDGSGGTVYEVAGGVRHYVGDPAQAECFHVNYGSIAVRIPNMNGNLPSVGVNALCQYPQNVAFYAPGGQERWRFSGTGPYTRERYANPLALHCYLGYTVTSKEIPSWLVDGLSNSPPEGPSLNCPNGSFVRVVETGQVFLVDNGVLRYVPNAATLTCLAGRPDPYIGSIPGGINATQGADAACSYEGRILVGTDGRQHWISGSQRYYIGNGVISYCIQVRNGTGQPIPESPEVIGSYADASRSAWCPYPDGTLVRGRNQTEVWRVYSNGTRHHINCLPPGAQVLEVPTGEPDGHQNLGQLSLC